ncbi:hypothetical protein [Alkalibacterium thalassium]|uniref:Uncharacterized protein n=1 Tax=Alkalibacterium thalassium TaxID=426701 RepID=A0A1G8WJP1_9LACT|nr:hypothetical protein [Alkalibacterium thalassium]SDJ78572.1 hypothetical protein SAMN04488098_100443 [Alkalibacterium thalassium]
MLIMVIEQVENRGERRFFSFLMMLATLSMTIWAIVCAMNMVAVIEKVHKDKEYDYDMFWLTAFFTVIVTVLTFLLVDAL